MLFLASELENIELESKFTFHILPLFSAAIWSKPLFDCRIKFGVPVRLVPV